MNKQNALHRNENAFTLIEVLIALVILAIGLLGVAKMQVVALNGNLAASDLTVATTLARDQIETLKGLDISSAEFANTNADNDAALSNPESAASLDQQDPNNPIDAGGGTTGVRKYSRFWNLAHNVPSQGTSTIVVFVYWGPVDEGGDLPRHHVAVPTIIAY